MTATQHLSSADVQQGEVVAIGSDTYNQVLGFLYREASLLDAISLKEWSALLATDLVYSVPLRQTRPMAQQAASIIRTVQHYHDDYRSIMGRVMRLTGTKSAWAEDPPSRTRRLVTNVQVSTTGVEGELAVVSYLLLTRSRFDSPDLDLISGERRDVLRYVAGELKLARREVILDQAVLGTPNLAIFL
ncbi:MAG: aromatic-ring-hydroxylating dioxygenase subunit beta [Proteobacteria bacterium]|nr:aromatic-ring-hydroxylating dioxygenase subunit beta [Pseudomonadota bacterium]